MATDLNLQQISHLLDQKLDQKLLPIQKELEKHTTMLDSHSKLLELHSKILESHTKKFESHGKMLKSLKRDQNTMLAMLDSEQMDQRKRLDEVERRLGFSSVA